MSDPLCRLCRAEVEHSDIDHRAERAFEDARGDAVVVADDPRDARISRKATVANVEFGMYACALCELGGHEMDWDTSWSIDGRCGLCSRPMEKVTSAEDMLVPFPMYREETVNTLLATRDARIAELEKALNAWKTCQHAWSVWFGEEGADEQCRVCYKCQLLQGSNS